MSADQIIVSAMHICCCLNVPWRCSVKPVRTILWKGHMQETANTADANRDSAYYA
jgi:hypothetical protein